MLSSAHNHIQVAWFNLSFGIKDKGIGVESGKMISSDWTKVVYILKNFFASQSQIWGFKVIDTKAEQTVAAV